MATLLAAIPATSNIACVVYFGLRYMIDDVMIFDNLERNDLKMAWDFSPPSE